MVHTTLTHIVKYVLSLWILLSATIAAAQHRDTWTAFYDNEEESYLLGFKNSKGAVMISPKFMGFTTVRKWDHIAAFMEDSSGLFLQYYMLKDGTKFGRDSLYIFDMSFDCESEGYIKFRDPVSGHTGMFDSVGKIAIPPVYNDITAFRNGMAVALKGAYKKRWDTDSGHSGCDHWSWEGGEELLIDQQNNVLISGFPASNDLDIYSMKMDSLPETDSTRVYFRGKDQRYYSFTDKLQYFRQFLFREFLTNISQDQLIQHAYKHIIHWDDDSSSWQQTSKEHYIKQHYGLLSQKLTMLLDTTTVYSISLAGFLPHPEVMLPELEHCYDNCGQWNTSRYPLYQVSISHFGPGKRFLYQDYLNFVKINEKILLISSSLHKNKK